MNSIKICVHIPVHRFTNLFIECLNSVLAFDEIIIQDNSKDDDVKQYLDSLNNYKIKHFETDIQDIRKRLLFFKNHSTCDYILWVHSDEVYNQELINEIYNKLEQNPNADGLLIPHNSIDFAHDFGRWPVPQLRLVKRDQLQFSMMNIHEMPVVSGNVLLLENGYLHTANSIVTTSVLKNVTYEYLSIQDKDLNTLETLSFDNKSKWWRVKMLVTLFLKMNYYFIKNVRPFQGPVYAHVCIGIVHVMMVLLKSLLPTDELRIRNGAIVRPKL